MILSEELLKFCCQHEKDDTHRLALEASKYPEVNILKAIQQIKGLQIAKQKLPTFYQNNKIIYPQHLSLEQCSSEETAKYKAEVAGSGRKMVDLTAGLGIDLYFISRNYADAIYVEQQKNLAQIAKHNFEVLGARNIESINADGVEYLNEMNRVDLIFLDPARRNDIGKKTVLIADCTPNLLDIQNTLMQKGDKVIVKLSPMLDVTRALQELKNIREVHIVSVRNECKELLLVMQEGNKSEVATLHCINIERDKKEHFTFSKEQEQNATSQYTNAIGKHLYEPNASIMKAGAYSLIGSRFRLRKLHANTHLYTSDALDENFPGRIFQVRKTFSLNKKEIKQDIKEANIVTRNFPLKPEELRKRLKLKDGGSHFIFGTTLSDEKRVLILCDRLL